MGRFFGPKHVFFLINVLLHFWNHFGLVFGTDFELELERFFLKLVIFLRENAKFHEIMVLSPSKRVVQKGIDFRYPKR